MDENIIYYHFKNMPDDMKFTSVCIISRPTSVTNFKVVKFHVRSDVRLTRPDLVLFENIKQPAVFILK